LRENRGLSVLVADRRAIVDDAGGDAIDAVIAAFATARASAGAFAVPPPAQAACALEGYVYT
jgi:hypothetical protein